MPSVIVDTSVWVQSFRLPDSPEKQEVERLIQNRDVAMVGPVYAELLRGARDGDEFRLLEETLGALPFLESDKEAWQRTGRLLFDLGRRGVTLSFADALIAALALEGDHQVYTLDEHFQRVPGLRLYEASTTQKGR